MQSRKELLTIFIINLKKDKEKKQHMQKLCQRHDLEVEFVEAVDGKVLSNDEIFEVYTKESSVEKIGRALSTGEIGCALSHLNIYQQMIDQNIQMALILEDDVDFKIDHQDLIHIIEKSPKDWECIMLGYHTKRSRDIDALASFWNKRRITVDWSCVRFAEQPVGAYGYIINHAGALKRLNTFKIIDRPIDHWSDEKLNLYGIQPAIVKINAYFENHSSLTPERSKALEKVYRTSYGRFKDKIRLILTKIQLLEGFYILRSFIIKFKVLKKYSLD